MLHQHLPRENNPKIGLFQHPSEIAPTAFGNFKLFIPTFAPLALQSRNGPGTSRITAQKHGKIIRMGDVELEKFPWLLVPVKMFFLSWPFQAPQIFFSQSELWKEHSTQREIFQSQSPFPALFQLPCEFCSMTNCFGADKNRNFPFVGSEKYQALILGFWTQNPGRNTSIGIPPCAKNWG